MVANMPPQTDDKPVQEGLSIQRPYVETAALQVEKMKRGDAGPGIKPILGGTRNSDASYVGFVSSLAAQSPATRCYNFREAVDHISVRDCVPEGMWKEPPTLVAELMGQAPAVVAAAQGNLLQQLQLRRAANKGKSTASQLN